MDGANVRSTYELPSAGSDGGSRFMTIDYREYPVLFVDDERQNLVTFRYAFEDRFHVMTASSGEEALEILKEHDVSVLLVDQRMPHMTGVDVCREARALRPDTVRIIVTAYADLHAAIDAINEGQVSRYLTKPWRNEEVAAVLRTSIELVHLQHTLRDMEVRLLRSGQQATVQAVQDELAHELSNPLSALAVNAQLVADLLDSALREVSEQHAAHAFLQNAREAQTDAVAGIEQLQSLITRLRRSLPSEGAGKPQAVCDATRVVESTVRILRTELERVARVELDLVARPTVSIDATALGQIMLNLLLNAAHALVGAPGADHVVGVRVEHDDDQARILVSDTGPGVPEELRWRIFDPYFTTKEASSGLGLSIARDLIHQTGGDIELVESKKRGACFVVTLPALGA